MYTDQYRAKKALKDIICYKIVCVGDHKMEGFKARYYTFSYEIGKTYTEQAWRNIANAKSDLATYKWCVMIGFHSYTSYWTAYDNTYPGLILLKCVIPKGSFYFEGVDSTGEKCYCSNSIKPIAYQTLCDRKWYITPWVEYKKKPGKNPGKNPK